MNESMRDHVLKSRYLLSGEHTFPDLCRRVADAIGREDDEREAYFEMMNNLEFLPNSPTLMNAGTACNQLAACFVIPIGSTIAEIFEAVRQGAIIQITGGGTGYNFSAIPPEGSELGSAGGQSPGPVRFMEIFDTSTEVIRQGGRRRGANMGILDVAHPDILSFITAKHEERVLTNFNLSVMIPDSFMEAIQRGADETILFTHRITEKSVTVGEVFGAIVEGIYRNGEPGVLFSDTINQGNKTPRLGTITATNPCGEEPLLPFESCILGSINLTRFIRDGAVEWRRLGETVRLAVHFLNTAIDRTSHPLPEIREATLRTRKIGIGVMGLHDALLLSGLPYDSEDARRFAEGVISFITQMAVDESQKIADETGPFPAWEGSSWKEPIRNAALTTIAPTGTISLIAGCSSGIEPVYSFVMTRHYTAGASFEVIHPLFSEQLDSEIAHLGYHGVDAEAKRMEVIEEVFRSESLQRINWLSPAFRRLYRSATEISIQDHLLMQAAFQRHIHASISKTINIREDIERDEIREALLLAWRLRLKGVTLYRKESRNEIIFRSKGCAGCRDTSFE
ncbi:adenosylcobalamin-dependent ribonucleoside-diphosphate reductase [Methanocalculus sp.]|uniref:adenosylcobalamin-dependent ribonucleoside-diphosphate reductase n=1 Tax=Methanocalculus sp. TaxID=2004547 RepID=UPI0027288903|nr:adenosylcobalamin-dependent ribonucleoside-diphosphate reductase [Methanocalculus sp.]MDO8841105.1 adenosylcobalamin-dependent ribonucleoside-diphosphate reductase [Methanocalculus sp.]